MDKIKKRCQATTTLAKGVTEGAVGTMTMDPLEDQRFFDSVWTYSHRAKVGAYQRKTR